MMKYLLVILCSADCVQAALALPFIYQSGELQFIQSYLGGEPSDQVGTSEPPFPSFTTTLVGTIENLTATLVAGDLSAGFPGEQKMF